MGNTVYSKDRRCSTLSNSLSIHLKKIKVRNKRGFTKVISHLVEENKGCMFDLCWDLGPLFLLNQSIWQAFKGTHTVYFSSSFYIINQKSMIHRTDFHCITTWVARSSGWNSAKHLLILLFRVHQPDGAIIQYKFLF